MRHLALVFVAALATGCQLVTGDYSVGSSGGSGSGGSGGSSGSSSGASSGSGSSSGGSVDAGEDSRSDAEAGPCTVTNIPGLVAYYTFDGNPKDSSGNGYDADASVMYEPKGVIGQAALFNGSTSSVVVSTSIANASIPRTFCAWVSPVVGTTGLGLPVFLSGTSITNPSTSFDQFSVAASTLRTGSCGGAASNALFLDHHGVTCATSPSAVVSPSKWTFVCYETSNTPGMLQFYVDATPTSIAGTTFDWPYVAIGTNTAAGGTTGPAFNGGIDEVSLWSAQLTPAQVAVLYNGGAGCRAHE
jgi:hypothetical protein